MNLPPCPAPPHDPFGPTSRKRSRQPARCHGGSGLIARWRPAIAALLACQLALAAPAQAAIGDDTAAQPPFLSQCHLTETCRIDGGCADLPAPGEQIIRFDGTDTFIGQAEDSLRPVDRFARIEDVHPLPRVESRRRSLLVDLPAERVDRRFALFVQRPTPEQAEPVLQRVYFILDCWDATP